MPSLTPTTSSSMKDWMPGWSIAPCHVLAGYAELTSPSPVAAADISNEWDASQAESLWAQELLEDHEAAEKALEQYEASGIEGTIPYSEYRARRLGSES